MSMYYVMFQRHYQNYWTGKIGLKVTRYYFQFINSDLVLDIKEFQKLTRWTLIFIVQKIKFFRITPTLHTV